MFLKAYYHFLLLTHYGPVVISEKSTAPDANAAELFPKRSKVDDCFDYIVRTMDTAIEGLQERAGSSELGQVDKIVATSIKARVLLFRASPFYSGNKEYFGDFLDFDGQPFFPVDDDAAKTKAKWKDAVDAIDAAINLCKENGKDLYVYTKEPYIFDREFFAVNRDKMQTYYDLRMSIVDSWNKELIWAISNLDFNITQQGELAHTTNIPLPPGYTGVTDNTNYTLKELGASYQMLERFYTKNGLPIDEDLTFDYNSRFTVITTPGVDEAAFQGYQGIMQPGAESLNLYMNREIRFYTNLGITGGYWRSHENLISTQFYAGTGGGYASVFGTKNLYSGIGIQKWSHPETRSGAWERVILYPYPVMRMADLYLMKAEALNEYNDVPTQEVYDAINVVRRRAGIPDVEVVWSEPSLAKSPNKHKTKSGMRDIILYERSVELAFEGSHFWDMIRHKRAVSEFSKPSYGWAYMGATASTFFILQPKRINKFSITDYLWPIDLNEINTNANLKQNPGW
jgi:hypothetical protein